jgi:hypothetical protein
MHAGVIHVDMCILRKAAAREYALFSGSHPFVISYSSGAAPCGNGLS